MVNLVRTDLIMTSWVIVGMVTSTKMSPLDRCTKYRKTSAQNAGLLRTAHVCGVVCGCLWGCSLFSESLIEEIIHRGRFEDFRPLFKRLCGLPKNMCYLCLTPYYTIWLNTRMCLLVFCNHRTMFWVFLQKLVVSVLCSGWSRAVLLHLY